MKIIGYYLLIKRQFRNDSEPEKCFEGNFLSEEIVIDTIKEHLKWASGNKIEIMCGANIINDEINSTQIIDNEIAKMYAPMMEKEIKKYLKEKK